jgi:hypothetical protein
MPTLDYMKTCLTNRCQDIRGLSESQIQERFDKEIVSENDDSDDDGYASEIHTSKAKGKRKRANDCTPSPSKNAPSAQFDPPDRQKMMALIFRHFAQGLTAVTQSKGKIMKSAWFPLTEFKALLDSRPEWEANLAAAEQSSSGAALLTNALTKSAVKNLHSANPPSEYTVQVIDISSTWVDPMQGSKCATNSSHRRSRKVTLTISDGEQSMHAVLASQMHALILAPPGKAPTLRPLSLIKVNDHTLLFQSTKAGGVACRVLLLDTDVVSTDPSIIHGIVLPNLFQCVHHSV